jgi:Histidinol dehydrogenase
MQMHQEGVATNKLLVRNCDRLIRLSCIFVGVVLRKEGGRYACAARRRRAGGGRHGLGHRDVSKGTSTFQAEELGCWVVSRHFQQVIKLEVMVTLSSPFGAVQVDKILGPGNQYVTAAKMLLQNSEAMISMDMPAGPSEVCACPGRPAVHQHATHRHISSLHALQTQMMSCCYMDLRRSWSLQTSRQRQRSLRRTCCHRQSTAPTAR